MSNPYEQAINAIGETAEAGAGARLVLPNSYYPVQLSIEDMGVSDAKADGTGLTPFVEISGLVLDGPFKNEEVRRRLYMSMGKDGGYLAFQIHTAKAISGEDVDPAALGEYGFPVADNGAAQEDVRLAWRGHFLTLDGESRLDFMVKFLRVAKWNGKSPIAAIGVEMGETGDPDPVTGKRKLRPQNKWVGFYAMNDPKKGIAYVKRVCFPKQVAEKERMAAEGTI